MSIIQEALKKVQDHKEKDKIKKHAYVSKKESDRIILLRERHSAPGKKDNATNNYKKPFLAIAILLTAAALTAGLIAARIIFKRPNVMAVNESASAPVQEVSYRPISNILPRGNSSGISKNTPPELILNGVMYLEKSPKAIINNSILAEGDTVRGARVVKINKKSVILLSGDTEITLRLK